MMRIDRWLKVLLAIAVPLAVLAFLALAAQARAQGVNAPAATAGEPAKPMIRYKASVVDGVIRLGDLFDNVGAKAEIPIDIAPAPGATATFQPSKLAQIARTHGLEWQPASYLDRVIVERAGKVVPREVVETAIKRVLAQNGSFGNLDIELADRAFRMFVAENQPVTVSVDLLYLDADSRTFSIDLRAPADDPRAERVRVMGRAHTLVDIPVLNRRIGPTEVIRKADVTWTRVRSNPGMSNVVNTMDDLVGMLPRRPLEPGQLVRLSDVGPHLIVQRNDMVVVMLRTANMTLTVQGRALDEGAEGAVVRVLNTKSSKTVEGKVTGPGEVTVGYAPRVAQR
ncbi:MAG: flagellar basal body P-ring formation protein FlgA [Proteobacteria bacterium]|nr:flagellar basal body P-ring formation protein FlgA [Pseudomonadota bacterium]